MTNTQAQNNVTFSFPTDLRELAVASHELAVAFASATFANREKKAYKHAGCASESKFLTEHLGLPPALARRIINDTNLIFSLSDPTSRDLIINGNIDIELARWIRREINSLDTKVRKDTFNEMILIAAETPTDECKNIIKKIIDARSITDPIEHRHRRAEIRTKNTGNGEETAKTINALFTGAQAAEIEARLHNTFQEQYKGEKENRTHAQRMADAMHSLITGQGTGANNLALVIPIDHDHADEFITNRGATLNPEDAQHIAANADTWWVMLADNLTWQPLALGRSKRLATHGQRMALLLQQRHCAIPGCDHPAAKCQAHHIQPWEHDGTTDLTNIALVCPGHHNLLTHGHITMTRENNEWVFNIGGNYIRTPTGPQPGSAIARAKEAATTPAATKAA